MESLQLIQKRPENLWIFSRMWDSIETGSTWPWLCDSAYYAFLDLYDRLKLQRNVYMYALILRNCTHIVHQLRSLVSILFSTINHDYFEQVRAVMTKRDLVSALVYTPKWIWGQNTNFGTFLTSAVICPLVSKQMAHVAHGSYMGNVLFRAAGVVCMNVRRAFTHTLKFLWPPSAPVDPILSHSDAEWVRTLLKLFSCSNITSIQSTCLDFEFIFICPVNTLVLKVNGDAIGISQARNNFILVPSIHVSFVNSPVWIACPVDFSV